MLTVGSETAVMLSAWPQGGKEGVDDGSRWAALSGFGPGVGGERNGSPPIGGQLLRRFSCCRVGHGMPNGTLWIGCGRCGMHSKLCCRIDGVHDGMLWID